MPLSIERRSRAQEHYESVGRLIDYALGEFPHWTAQYAEWLPGKKSIKKIRTPGVKLVAMRQYPPKQGQKAGSYVVGLHEVAEGGKLRPLLGQWDQLVVTVPKPGLLFTRAPTIHMRKELRAEWFLVANRIRAELRRNLRKEPGWKTHEKEWNFRQLVYSPPKG